MTVNTGSFIPPALLRLCIHSHCNCIDIVSISGIWSDINIHRSVTTPVTMQDSSIYPNCCMSRNSIKLYFEMLAFVFRSKSEFTPIPTKTTVTIPLRQIGIRIYASLNRPIMWQINHTPGRIIVIR